MLLSLAMTIPSVEFSDLRQKPPEEQTGPYKCRWADAEVSAPAHHSAVSLRAETASGSLLYLLFACIHNLQHLCLFTGLRGPIHFENLVVPVHQFRDRS